MARSLAAYWGDRGHEYTTAAQIAKAFMADMDLHPKYFKRKYIAEKLKLQTSREFELLSDALYVLKQKKMIEFDRDQNMWRNLVRA